MRNRRGFTLIEILVVLLIMSILVATAVPLAQVNQRRSREVELRANLRMLRSAIDEYKRQWDAGRIERKPDDTGYPPDLATLVDGVVDKTDPKGRRIYFLRRVPRDPFASVDLPAQDTWILRAYDSPADDPAKGRDVYDVIPTARGRALDGSTYRQW